VVDTLAATFTPPTGVLEHVALNGVQLATFTDATNPTAAASHFTATITWNDKTTSAGIITALGNGRYAVTVSGHTFADEGAFAVSVQIGTVGSTLANPPTATANGSITAGENDVLTGKSVTVNATEKAQFNGPVATFTDTDLVSVAGDFVATIDWGDGSKPTTGIVQGSNGKFTVVGTHTYQEGGSFKLKVTLKDGDGTATATVTTTIKVANAPARVELQDALGILNGVSGTGLSKHDAELLAQAIAQLTTAQTASFWVTPAIPMSSKINQVLSAANEASKKLEQLLKKSAIPSAPLNAALREIAEAELGIITSVGNKCNPYRDWLDGLNDRLKGK
jgi:hypothetical protein